MTTGFATPFAFVNPYSANPFACTSPFGVQPSPFYSLTPWNAVPGINTFNLSPFNSAPFYAYSAFTPSVNPFTTYGTVNPFTGFNPSINPFAGNNGAYNPSLNPFSTPYNLSTTIPFAVSPWNNPITGSAPAWQNPLAYATQWNNTSVPFASTPNFIPVPVVTSQHNATPNTQPGNTSSNPNSTQGFVSFFPTPLAGPFGIGGYWTSTQQASSWSTPANGGCSTAAPVAIQRSAA